MKSYKDLEIWQKSVTIVTEIYNLLKRFPKDEKFALSLQIQRAAISIPSNIAEGWGRETTRDYLRFLFKVVFNL